MNKLILIGNGFDLVHGLKTRFKDFILWFLNKNLNISTHFKPTDNDLLRIRIQSPIAKQDFKTIQHFNQYIKTSEPPIELTYKYDFFKDIVSECIDYNWVDIEYKYYKELIDHYLALEHARTKESRNPILTSLKNLNICLDI